MIIVSNDTGFDAVVSFWIERGYDIKRLPTNHIEPKKTGERNAPVSSEKIVTPQTVEVPAKIYGVEQKEIYTVINCLGCQNSSYIWLILTFMATRKAYRFTNL